MHFKILPLLLLASLFLTKLDAQAWKNIYGNQFFHAGKGVVQLTDGNLMMLVEADTSCHLSARRISYLLHLNPAGELIAQDTFPLKFSQLHVLENGQFLLYGLSPTPRIYKFNRNGEALWQQNFTEVIVENGVIYEPAAINGIVDLTDGNIFIHLKYKNRDAAYSLDDLQSLVKLDAQGNIAATTRSHFDCGTTPIQGGRINEEEVIFGHGFSNALWAKTNLQGEMIWEEDAECRRSLDALMITDNDKLMTTEAGGIISKLDSNGNQIWTTSTLANLGLQADLTQLIKSLDGGFVLAGNINNYDLLVVKIDDAGNFIWKQIFESKQIHRIKGLIETDDGHYLLSGLQKKDGSDPFKAFLLKTDQLGFAHSLIWGGKSRATLEK